MKRISICWPNHFSHVSRNRSIWCLVNKFGGKWKNLGCQVNICLQFPEIHEKVTCYVCMGDGIMIFLKNTNGVKQGSPLSPTLFGLCIDELEEMVTKFIKEECVEEVVIGNVVIMLLRTHAILEILSVGSSRNIFSTLW